MSTKSTSPIANQEPIRRADSIYSAKSVQYLYLGGADTTNQPRIRDQRSHITPEAPRQIHIQMNK